MDCRVDWLMSDDLWTGLTYQLWTVELTDLSVMDCGVDWLITCYGLWSWLTYQWWTVELTDLSVMDCRVDWLIRDELWSGLTYQLLTVELTNLSVMDCGDDWPISYWLWSGLPPCILGLTTQVSIQILILIDCWQKTRNFLPHNVWYALTIYTLDLKS